MLRILFLAVTGLIYATHLAAQQVGVLATANPTIRIESSYVDITSASVGDPIHEGDTISTGAAASTQIIFSDQTVLSLGPNTEIEITSFVYSSSASADNMALTLLRGVCRIIGGFVTSDNPASIRSTSGIVGIRGSTAIIRVDDTTGTTEAIFVDGDQMCMTGSDGSETCTSRRGGVLQHGQYVGSVNASYVEQLLSQMRGR